MEHEIFDISIVLLGEFNPVIIQPFWLANKKIIREQEAKSAKLNVIHNELSRFQIGDWLLLEVSKNRFLAQTAKEPYIESLRDAVTLIFKLLPETPIKALGINHNYHYNLRNAEKYYNLGSKLSNLDVWDNKLKDPKLLQLEVTEQNRADGNLGYVRVKVQPSDLVSPFGVSISINDHYTIPKDSEGRSGEMAKALVKNWEKSILFGKGIIENFWDKNK